MGARNKDWVIRIVSWTPTVRVSVCFLNKVGQERE